MPTSTNTTGTTILPDTTGRFGLVQVLDAYGRGGLQLNTAQITAEAPHYDSVWGSFFPSTWSAAHPGMILSRYYMPYEDNNLVSGNTLSYFLTNHPDWILYGCDNNNNPTTDYAYTGTGFNDVPLDIHNPAVVTYQLNTILAFLTANGYNALAIDNVVFENFLTSPNPILQHGMRSNAGWYGCGIYTSGPSNPGSFVRRYNGPLDNTNDATFNADVNNWIAQAHAMLGKHGIKVLVNHPPHSSTPSSNELTMLSNIDGMLDENGYTHYGTLLTGSAYANTLSWVQYLQAHGIAALITDYYCTGTSGCSNDPSTLTAKQVDWALASYAIGNNGGENVFISPHGGAIPSYRGEYSTRYGNACSGFTQVSSNVYMRRFQGGLAIVNATGGTPFSLTLPAGHNYSDIEGRPVTNPLIVNPTDAYMLLTGGNGCS